MIDGVISSAYKDYILQCVRIEMEVGRLYRSGDYLNKERALSCDERARQLSSRVSDLLLSYGVETSAFPLLDGCRRGCDMLQAILFGSASARARLCVRDTASEIHTKFNLIFGHLKRYEEDIKAQKKWREVGLPEEVIERTPNLVTKLYRSGQLFSIVGFKRFERGGEHRCEVCYEGRYIDIVEFDEKVEVDRIHGTLMLRGEDGILVPLLYFPPPRGFIKFDQLKNQPLTPVGQLSDGEFSRLKEHAARFDASDEQGVVGILQVCTRVGPSSGIADMPQFLSDENVDNIPSHYFSRLIDTTGQIFSFGFTTPYRRHITSAGVIVPGLIQQIDSCEFRSQDLVVTSLPIKSQEAVTSLIQFAHQEAPVFNTFTNNCATFQLNLMRRIGVHCDARRSAQDILWRVFQEPAARLPVFKCGAKVANIVRSYFEWLSCEPLERVAQDLHQHVVTLFDTATALAKNGLLFLIGGSRVHSSLEMAPMLASFSDWCNPRTTDLDSGVAILDWQKKQATTERFAGRQIPAFHILKSLEEM